MVKSRKIGQKKSKKSYATVLAEERVEWPFKKKVKSNRSAYIAWQERHGVKKPEKGNHKTTPKILEWPEIKVEDSTTMTKKKKIPEIPLTNRYAILSDSDPVVVNPCGTGYKKYRRSYAGVMLEERGIRLSKKGVNQTVRNIQLGKSVVEVRDRKGRFLMD